MTLPAAPAATGDATPGTGPYAVKLPSFEGPLDLLLHLIRLNEVEIADIPIARIGQQYLEYLDLMRELDFDVAGWSRTAKSIDGVTGFHGDDQLVPFLKRSEILACLLPLTPDTRGIVDLPVTIPDEAILDAKALDGGGIAYSVSSKDGMRVMHDDCN